MSRIRKLVFLAIFVALASTLHAVEMFFPNPFPVPGAKLGLANIVTLTVLVFYSLKEGMAVAILRVLMGSLLSGAFLGVAFFLSLSGALVSTLIMFLFLKYTRGFSIIGISIIGAITHNITQLIVVSMLICTFSVFYYLPFLLLFAIPTGLSTGLLAKMIIKRLRAINIIQPLPTSIIFLSGKSV